MTRRSDAYIRQIWPFSIYGKDGPFPPLTQQQATLLAGKLREDAVGGYFSALVTMADALRALDQKFYSWSAVKLYYLVTIAMQGYLAAEGAAMFHLGRYPRWCEALAGQLPLPPQRRSGQLGSSTSHKMAMNLFRSRHGANILLSQDIDGISPPDWLQDQREFFNYRQGRFTEPTCPKGFEFVEKRGLRAVLDIYLHDDEYLYCFDPDHALLAYPVAFLKMARARFVQQNIIVVSDEDRGILESYWRDHFGPLHIVGELVRRAA